MLIKNNNENLYFKPNIKKIYKENTIPKMLNQNNISFKGPVNKNGLKFICNIASKTCQSKNANQITFTELQTKTICNFMQNCSYGYADFIKKQLPFNIQNLYYKKDKNSEQSYVKCDISYQLPKQEHIGACQNLAKQLYDYLNTQEIFINNKNNTKKFDINIAKGLYLSKYDRMSHFIVTISPAEGTYLIKPQIILDPSFNTIAHYNPITFPKYMSFKSFEISKMENMQNTFSLESNLKQPFGFAKDLLKKCPDYLHNNLVYFDFNNGKTNFYIHSNVMNPVKTTVPRESLQIDLSYLENIEDTIQHHIRRSEYEVPHLFNN